MFQGDISNFSPADLLVFLAHLNKEGVLTVRRQDESLCFSFCQGFLIDAHSGHIDRRILDILRHHEAVGEPTLRKVEQAKRETDLPLRQIIEEIATIPEEDVAVAMTAGVREAVFRLFLWETGEFQFVELEVDPNRYVDPFDCQALAMDTAREIDEYREALRTLGSEDQALILSPGGRQADAGEGAVRYVLEHARGDHSLGELLSRGPYRSHVLALAVVRAKEQGWIKLVQLDKDNGPAEAASTADGDFPAFRRAWRGMLAAGDSQGQIRELAAYCRDSCACTLLLAVRDGVLVRCKSYQRDEQGSILPGDHRQPGVRLNIDPIFDRVHRSQLPFYGRVFASDLLGALGVEPPDGNCAVIPFGEVNDQKLMIYAAVPESATVPGPLHYLELMGWHVRPPAVSGATSREDSFEPAAEDRRVQPDEKGLQRLVGKIKELPAMPEVVTRILRLLADPECSMSAVTEALSRDPALVARLIKVSNSSLYGTNREISSLNQALVRLGFRTIRSLVIAASSRALFPMNDTQVGLWGKALWDHSVECGVAAKWVAQAVAYHDPDEAFAAGVLHDIGKVIILLNLPDDFRAVVKAMETGGLDSRAAEQQVLGFDHCKVGTWLLERWDLPPALTAGIVHHHEPAAAVEHEQLARIVACGDLLSHSFGVGTPWGSAPSAETLNLVVGELGLDPGRLDQLREMGLSGATEGEPVV